MNVIEAKPIKDLIPEYFDLMKKGKLNGISTGFEDLDKIISGWHNSELIIIGSRPAMGKTAFMLSIIKNVAVNSTIPTAVFSLEDSTATFINKLIANLTEINTQSLRTGKLKIQEWYKIEETIKSLENVPLYIDDTPRLSIQYLCDKAHRLVSENKVKIIFIDYIQLLSVTGKYTENRYNDLNYISRELKGLAKKLNIPIIATSQLNRNIDERQGYQGKIPTLTDLRDSGTLCDDADIVCFIHRPEYYGITEDNLGNSLIDIGEIIIAKNRNGVVGDIRLKFISASAKFENFKKELKK